MTPWKDFLIDLQHRINEESVAIVHKVSFPKESFVSSLFDPPFLVHNKDERKPGKGRPGIYLFVVDVDINMTYEEVMAWNSVDGSGAGFKEYKALSLKQGDLLYLGSAQKSLMQRLGQHFGPLIKKGNPKGLALSHPKRSLLSGKVHAIAFPLKSGFEEYGPLLLTKVEQQLHHTLKPKAGSCKV